MKKLQTHERSIRNVCVHTQDAHTHTHTRAGGARGPSAPPPAPPRREARGTSFYNLPLAILAKQRPPSLPAGWCGRGAEGPLAPPVCVCVCVWKRVRVWGDSAFVRYRFGVLSGWCAIGIVRDLLVCYRDVGYRVGALSGIVSIFRVLSGWCAIAPCANGTRSKNYW